MKRVCLTLIFICCSILNSSAQTANTGGGNGAATAYAAAGIITGIVLVGAYVIGEKIQEKREDRLVTHRGKQVNPRRKKMDTRNFSKRKKMKRRRKK